MTAITAQCTGHGALLGGYHCSIAEHHIPGSGYARHCIVWCVLDLVTISCAVSTQIRYTSSAMVRIVVMVPAASPELGTLVHATCHVTCHHHCHHCWQLWCSVTPGPCHQPQLGDNQCHSGLHSSAQTQEGGKETERG